MNKEITLDKLLQTPKKELLQQQHDLKQQQREYEVAMKAIEMLENIARSIREAGGVFDLQKLGNSKVGDLVLMFARNNIKMTVVYENNWAGGPPKSERKPTEVYDLIDRYETSPETAQIMSNKPGQVKTTNGYCDTCGDMWVKGYDSHHPTCQKWEGE